MDNDIDATLARLERELHELGEQHKIVLAAAEGRELEKRYKAGGGTWHPWSPKDGFMFGIMEYRVKPQVAYCNLYGNRSNPSWAGNTRQEADDRASPGRTGCIRVEFYHGQWDE